MPLDDLCIVCIFFALQYGLILRSGIVDAYQFKMSNRQIRQYVKTHSLWFRILLPYSQMKDCGAPRQMQLFHTLRIINWAAITIMLILAYILPPTHTITLIGYFFIGGYFALLYIPFLCYSVHLSNWPKGPTSTNQNDHEKSTLPGAFVIQLAIPHKTKRGAAQIRSAFVLVPQASRTRTRSHSRFCRGAE